MVRLGSALRAGEAALKERRRRGAGGAISVARRATCPSSATPSHRTAALAPRASTAWRCPLTTPSPCGGSACETSASPSPSQAGAGAGACKGGGAAPAACRTSIASVLQAGARHRGRLLDWLHTHACLARGADTFTTVLLPEDAPSSGSEEDEAAPGQPGSGGLGPGRRQASQARAAAGREPSEEEELVPLSAQVQARLEGLSLQLDTFAADGPGAGEGGCHTRTRWAVALRHLEVRDSFQPRPGGGGGGSGGSAAAAAAASAAATGWADLRRMLGYHASLHRARGPKAAMVQAVAEGVAEPGAGECRGGALCCDACMPGGRAAGKWCVWCSRWRTPPATHPLRPPASLQTWSGGCRCSCCRCWCSWTRRRWPSSSTFLLPRRARRAWPSVAAQRRCRGRPPAQRLSLQQVREEQGAFAVAAASP